jgi:DNA invertase Pin-like site-specific DNA recombinase
MAPRKDEGGTTGGERVALYLRVSTGGQTVKNQKHDLEATAKARGWTVAHVYKDEGISGAKGRDQRPALAAMMKDAARGRFDRIAAWSIDRLGRSTQHVTTILDELKALGVKQFFFKEGMDTATPHGRAMLEMAAVFASLEREMIRERVNAGLARARREGKRLGRPPADPKMVAKVRRLIDEGASVRQAAAKAGCSVGLAHKVSVSGSVGGAV